MGIVFKNNAKTTLASSLSNSATSATVTDGSVFPSLSAGEFFLVTFDDGTNNEICKCTARSGNTLTIVRAQESTTARAFSSGDAAEGRVTAGVLETIQENIAAKSANQTVFNTTTSGGATTYNIGTNPGVEANAMVFLNGVLQHHDTLSFSGTNLTFDAAPENGLALEVIIDNLINLQSSNLTVDSFTAADVSGSPQTDFTLSDTPAAETNLIVFIDGVFQDQDAYTISSNTLTITTGVIAGRGVTVYVINPVNIGTPSDSTVTSAKLSGNITMPGTLTVGANDVAFDSPTFVVDNANSRVGLGTASPSVPVDIVGDVKMSADLTVDTTTLVVDSSNNRVGIGTGTPQAHLDINTETAETTTVILNGEANQDKILRIRHYGNSEAAGDGYAGFIGSVVDNVLTLGHYNTSNAEVQVLHVTEGGDVGIGDSSPDAKLHINQGTAASGGSGDQTNANNHALYIENSGSNGYPRIVHKSASSIVASVTNAETGKNMYWGESTDTGNYYFRGRDLLVTDGNVGIGNTTPSSAYSYADDLVVGNTSGAHGISIVSQNNTNGALHFTDALAGDDGAASYAGWVAYNHASNYMFFGTSSTERLRLTATGGLELGYNGAGRQQADGQAFSIITPASGGGQGLAFKRLDSNNDQRLGEITWSNNTQDGLSSIACSTNGATNTTRLQFYNNSAGTEENVLELDHLGQAFYLGAQPAIFLTDNTGGGGAGNGGQIVFKGHHASTSDGFREFAKILGLKQNSTGGDTHGELRFYVNKGAASSSEVGRFNHDGDFLVGDTVYPTTSTSSFGAAAGGTISTSRAATNLQTHYFMQNPNGTVGSIKTTGSSTQFNTSSDYRLKENVSYSWNATTELLKLKPAKFNFKADPKTTVEGFLAHEVEDIVPIAVSGTKDEVYSEEDEKNKEGKKGDPKYQSIDQSKLVPLLVKTIQEQQDIIDDLKARIEALEG